MKNSNLSLKAQAELELRQRRMAPQARRARIGELLSKAAGRPLSEAETARYIDNYIRNRRATYLNRTGANHAFNGS